MAGFKIHEKEMYFSKYNFSDESESARKLFSNFWIPALLNIARLLYEIIYLQEWMWGWFRKVRSLGMSKYSRIIQVRDFKQRSSVFSIGILEGFSDNSIWKYKASKKSECQGRYLKNSIAKGQLISKCLIGSIVSTKKPTKFF